jgi:hypothetical protein
MLGGATAEVHDDMVLDSAEVDETPPAMETEVTVEEGAEQDAPEASTEAESENES